MKSSQPAGESSRLSADGQPAGQIPAEDPFELPDLGLHLDRQPAPELWTERLPVALRLIETVQEREQLAVHAAGRERTVSTLQCGRRLLEKTLEGQAARRSPTVDNAQIKVDPTRYAEELERPVTTPRVSSRNSSNVTT